MWPTLQLLALKKNEDKRLRAGHLWIYSNEIDTQKTPLQSFEAGASVVVEDFRGKTLGTAYVNPHTLICARMVSRSTKYQLNKSLFVHRLNVALSLRKRCFNKPFYRLAFAESDALPGLIIDRFNDVVVAQITTAGMEGAKQDIIDAIAKVINPRCLILRNDTKSRATEGLELYVETALGDTPQNVAVEENQAKFEFNALHGQKTGWFYDHRLNRSRFCNYIKGQKVLDVFSYIGAWGIQVAAADADHVVCLDASAKALELLNNNAQLNNLQNKITTIKQDAFEGLKSLRDNQEKFDAVILDPPAFIKRKKDTKQGLQAYHRINQLAIQLLNKDGLLLSASCSFHLKGQDLVDIIQKSARHLDRSVQIIEQGHQGPDHPIHPAITETNYLKSYLMRVTKN